jgi:anti-anti-sigma factor
MHNRTVMCAGLSNNLETSGGGEICIISIDVVRLMEGEAIDQCHREIVSVLDKTGERCVVLHFGRVSFMSSAALGMRIRVNKKCKEYKLDLKLCNISRDIHEVFKITRMDKIFDIREDVSQATEAFKKSGRLLFRRKSPTCDEVRDGS